MGPICLTNTGTPPDTSTASSRAADLLAGTGTDQVRAHDQAQDRKGARPRGTAIAARARRRGDRIEILFAAALPIIAALGAAIARSRVRQQQKRGVYLATSAPALATWPS